MDESFGVEVWPPKMHVSEIGGLPVPENILVVDSAPNIEAHVTSQYAGNVLRTKLGKHDELPPEKKQLPNRKKEHSKGDVNGPPFRDTSPILRRVLIGLFCTIGGISLSIWSIEKFDDKRRGLATALGLFGFLIIGLGWFLWWLTFAYPVSRNWLL